MEEILDPTISAAREHIAYVPRPQQLQGLRIGLIDNTRKNSDAVLQRLAERLRSVYGMSVETVVRKHQRAPLSEAQLAELRGRTDFVVAGVGD
jgi:hypothetical protein